VSVKLRLASFKTMTRSRTLSYPTDVAHEIYATACALYESAGLDDGARLRLVGVRVSGLVPAAGANAQLTFDDRPVGWREAEQADGQDRQPIRGQRGPAGGPRSRTRIAPAEGAF
jgi:DNA polymerase-4